MPQFFGAQRTAQFTNCQKYRHSSHSSYTRPECLVARARAPHNQHIHKTPINSLKPFAPPCKHTDQMEKLPWPLRYSFRSKGFCWLMSMPRGIHIVQDPPVSTMAYVFLGNLSIVSAIIRVNFKSPYSKRKTGLYL